MVWAGFTIFGIGATCGQIGAGHAIITQTEVTTLPAAIDLCMEQIAERRLPDGGFSEHLHGLYRPDATAWAAQALARREKHRAWAEGARAALAAGQQQDGRIALPGAPDAIWPTAAAVLAWRGDAACDQARERAVAFLLRTTGTHWRPKPQSPASHDTSLRGWPWNERTHSFVDPTATALLALDVSGHGSHERFREAVQMLLDRQLPRGGWNYGNTLVYGNELLPFADTTGLALAALAGHVPKENIGRSLGYLKAQAATSRTPLSLAWALFGLAAWGGFPEDGPGWIEETLDRQDRFGPYATSLLSLLALAYLTDGDIRRR